jgi:hypothetical protein
MGFTAAGISPTTVTTDQQCPLGFELTVPDGDKGFQTWVYVKAEAALSEGRIVMLEDAASAFEVTLSTSGGVNTNASYGRIVGVAQHTIASGSYGFVLARGFGTVLAGAAAGLTANEGITPGGTNVTALGGTALDFDAGTVAGGCVIGHCTVAAASSNLASAYIKCM